jgi:hypothetical protein
MTPGLMFKTESLRWDDAGDVRWWRGVSQIKSPKRKRSIVWWTCKERCIDMTVSFLISGL